MSRVSARGPDEAGHAARTIAASGEEGRLWDRTPGPVSANGRMWFNLASAGVPIWKTGAIMTRVTALS